MKHGNIVVPIASAKDEQALMVSDARERHADRQQERNIMTQRQKVRGKRTGPADW